MKKINLVYLVLAILMLSIVNPSFAANWQNAWSLEKVEAEKACADSYDHRECLQSEKKAYDAMQGDFGASTAKALRAKKRCVKVFHAFSEQARCVDGLLNREPVDKDILKACDVNGDGVINTKRDWKLGMVSREVAKKEHKCQLKKDIAKLDEENAKLDEENAKLDEENAKLDEEIAQGRERIAQGREEVRKLTEEIIKKLEGK